METIHTQNYRFQIWFNAMPDKILLGTVSVCSEDPESANRLVRAYTNYYLVATDNFNWEVKEPMALYSF